MTTSVKMMEEEKEKSVFVITYLICSLWNSYLISSQIVLYDDYYRSKQQKKGRF